jgi:hypothetical protein
MVPPLAIFPIFNFEIGLNPSGINNQAVEGCWFTGSGFYPPFVMNSKFGKESNYPEQNQKLL